MSTIKFRKYRANNLSKLFESRKNIVPRHNCWRQFLLFEPSLPPSFPSARQPQPPVEVHTMGPSRGLPRREQVRKNRRERATTKVFIKVATPRMCRVFSIRIFLRLRKRAKEGRTRPVRVVERWLIGRTPPSPSPSSSPPLPPPQRQTSNKSSNLESNGVSGT